MITTILILSVLVLLIALVYTCLFIGLAFNDRSTPPLMGCFLFFSLLLSLLSIFGTGYVIAVVNMR